MPYQDSQHFNGLPAPYNEAFPPLGKIGGIFLGTSDPDTHASNRNWYWVTKKSDVDQYFYDKVDPAIRWLETAPTPSSAIVQFDRIGGSCGDARRFWRPDELLKARKWKPYLVEGFQRNGALLADDGRQVVFHLGGPDSAHYAAGYINAGQQARLLKETCDIYGPLIRDGIMPGLDGASGENMASYSWALSNLFTTMGAAHQIESTPTLLQTHWKGKTCYLAYSLFKDRHLVQAPWAVNVYAKFGTPQFKEWHPDCRVAMWADNSLPGVLRVWQDKTQQTNFLKELALLTKPLIFGGAKVLLDEPIIKAAVDCKFPLASLLP